MNNRADIIKELFALIRGKNISTYDKETLIKIISLIEDYSHKNYLLMLENELASLSFNEDTDIKNEILILKMKSIISDLEKKSFYKKVIQNNCAIYYYKDKIDIYLKSLTEIDTIFEIIENNNKIYSVELIITHDKKNKSNRFIDETVQILINRNNYKHEISDLCHKYLNNGITKTLLLRGKILI